MSRTPAIARKNMKPTLLALNPTEILEPFRRTYNVIEVSQDEMPLFEPLEREVHGIIASPKHKLVRAFRKYWEEDSFLEGELRIIDNCMRFITMSSPKWWVLVSELGCLPAYLGKSAATYDTYRYAGWADDPSTESFSKAYQCWGTFNRTLPEHVYKPMPLTPSKRGFPQGLARAFHYSQQFV